MSHRPRTVRVICCSDTHSRQLPGADETGAATWLHSGDIYEAVAPRNNAAQKSACEAVARWLEGRRIPVFAVRGNHDILDPAGFFDGGRDLTGHVRKVADHLWLAGIGWFGDRPYDTPGESDLEKICDSVRRQALRQVMPSDRLILLTHYPAKVPGLFPLAGYAVGGVLDCVRRLVEDLKPVAVVQGHVHEWFGTSATFEYAGGRSLLVNPGPSGAILKMAIETGRVSCEFCEGDPP